MPEKRPSTHASEDAQARKDEKPAGGLLAGQEGASAIRTRDPPSSSVEADKVEIERILRDYGDCTLRELVTRFCDAEIDRIMAASQNNLDQMTNAVLRRTTSSNKDTS